MEHAHERITTFLADHHIPFDVIDHDSAGSVQEYQRAMNTRLQQQAKALFVRYKTTNEKAFAIVAIQGQKKADLNLIRQLLHAKDIRLGTADQLREVTGCSYGELPPMGKVFNLPLIMDHDLLNESQIYFNAGLLTRSIRLNPSDLAKAEQPLIYKCE